MNCSVLAGYLYTRIISTQESFWYTFEHTKNYLMMFDVYVFVEKPDHVDSSAVLVIESVAFRTFAQSSLYLRHDLNKLED